TTAYDDASCNVSRRERRRVKTAKSATAGVCRSGTAAKMTAASKPALDGSSLSMRSRPAIAISRAKKRSWLTEGHTTLTAAAMATAAMADTRNHAERDMGGWGNCNPARAAAA